jgi:hypothetical protein
MNPVMLLGKKLVAHLPFVTRSLLIWLVREEDSYVDIHHNFMSYLPCVIATVLFMRTIWIKNLKNLIFFVPKDIFTCKIVNIPCLYEYFGLYTVPQTFRVLQVFHPQHTVSHNSQLF